LTERTSAATYIIALENHNRITAAIGEDTKQEITKRFPVFLRSILDFPAMPGEKYRRKVGTISPPTMPGKSAKISTAQSVSF
jgi:hypothetical protein